MHAKRSHTRTHRVRWATASHAESLTDRPRVCACATPRRPLLGSTFPLLTRPDAHAKRAASVSQGAPERCDGARDLSLRARARVLSGRLTVAPFVRVTIVGTSDSASRALRIGQRRTATVSSLLCISPVACGQTATVSVLCPAVCPAGVCRGMCGRVVGRQNGQS